MAGSPGPPKLRWRLADDDAGGQGALFETEVERHIGKGEFRGMEFLHVHARRIINEVPRASMVPFRYTINAYRGCSHACSYCLEGSTPVLMADGSTKPIAELRVGEEIYGTRREGTYRRLVKTTVLDHWSTVKPAYRVLLSDGTELICSGDHRFLTDRGWKHVRGPALPHLVPGDRLLGPGRFGEGAGILKAVEALGVQMPLYDITTGSGDFVADGVISHNCFARPTHDYLGLNIGEDFERRIVVKVNAVERLRAELAPGRWAGEHIAMGTNTDPYQRCEGKYRLTRGIVEVLGEARNPFSILTKSTLILRDLDVLTEAAERTEVRANFSIGTLDEEVWRSSEPGTPHPLKRIEAVAKLNEAGIRCGVLIAPVLPGLSDREDQLEAVVKACVEAGAESISPILLHLRPGVRDHYMNWLAGAYPELVDRHEEMYPRSYAPKCAQNDLSATVRRLLDRHRRRPASPSRLRSVRPTSKKGREAAAPKPEQLGLQLG